MQKKTTFFLVLFSIFVLWSPGYVLAETGYDRSVTMWKEVVARVSPYRSTLQNLYAEVEYQLGADKSKLIQAFSKRLGREYPGSYYGGGSFGKLVLNNYTQVSFDAQWNIIILSQRFGSLVKIYNFRQNTLEISNGPNKISMRFDLRYPARSRFTQATIPALAVTAKNVWAWKGVRQNFPSPLLDILNDVYAYKIAAENSIRMDQLAENMINNEGTRHYVLKDAEVLYRSGRQRQTTKVGTTRRVTTGRSTSHVLQATTPYAVLNLFFWPGIIAIVIIGGITVAMRSVLPAYGHVWKKYGPLKQKFKELAEDVRYESRKTLHSPAELAFHKVLQEVVDGDRYQINGKTRLADLIQVETQLWGPQWQYQFNRIKSKHVDFVLLEKSSSRIIGVIELDDSSHLRPDRQARDRFVDRALERAGIPILHYPCMREYFLPDVENMLRETFAIDLKNCDFRMGPATVRDKDLNSF